VKRLNFCIWTQGHSIWIPSDQWDACRSTVVATDARRAVRGAFDLSMKIDLTGCVIAQRFDDESPESRPKRPSSSRTTRTARRQEGLEGQLPDPAEGVRVDSGDTMLERVKNEHIPYDLWERGSSSA
jgi:hypothetical protein